MDLPENLRALLEVLRGGNVPADQMGPATSRRMPDGSVVQNPKPYGSSVDKKKLIPTKMRGYQLYNKEQIAQGMEPVSYREWLLQAGTE